MKRRSSQFPPYSALEYLLEHGEPAETVSFPNSTIAPKNGSNSNKTKSVVVRVAALASLRDGLSKRSGTIS